MYGCAHPNERTVRHAPLAQQPVVQVTLKTLLIADSQGYAMLIAQLRRAVNTFFWLFVPATNITANTLLATKAPNHGSA
jgi:hypothetical protein